MTRAEMHAWFRGRDVRQVRMDAGLSLRTVAAGLGVSLCTLSEWERGRYVPCGVLGDRYVRLIGKLERHLEVEREPCLTWWCGW